VEASTSDLILEEITESDPVLGQTVRNLMFVFADLLQVDVQAIRTLMGRIDRKTLLLALKGCSPQLKNHFTSSMSNSASSILFEDMEALGPVRIRDVEEAQQQIIAIARQLETEGAISLKASGSDQYVV
jgi:flagellar motor switch protein FliG